MRPNVARFKKALRIGALTVVVYAIAAYLSFVC